MIGDRFLAERIEKNAGFDCAVFRHGNLVIMLCHDPDRDEIVSYLRSRAHSLGFIAAVSKRFSPLTTMPVIFDQTRRILDDGKSLNPGTRVFVDDDFGLRVIISKLLEQYSISELCHSGVLRLYENDREHGTDYTDTLLVFLENDRNVLQTSRSLFIHRNTLLRRLERISSFIDVNDCPASTRHYILFSLIVLKYCEQPEN
jgi:DNA-binding PucR family transcriptional regulator